jgi:hypothetical protein
MISTAACAVGAASAEIPRLESANPASPNFQFVMVSFRLPLLKERQNLLARPSTSAQSSSATTSTYSTFRANNAIAVSSSACGRLPFPRAAHSIKMEARLIQFE